MDQLQGSLIGGVDHISVYTIKALENKFQSYQLVGHLFRIHFHAFLSYLLPSNIFKCEIAAETSNGLILF